MTPAPRNRDAVERWEAGFVTGTWCWAAGSVSVLASSLGAEMAAGFIFSSLAQGASWMGTGLGQGLGSAPEGRQCPGTEGYSRTF